MPDGGNNRTSILIKLLLPIARACIRLRIPLQEVYEGLKIAFVEEACRNLDRNDEKKSLSRISIITGLDRPTVKRIFQKNAFSSSDTPVTSKVIGQWQHDSKYKSRSGKIRGLSIGTDDSEFAQLIRQVTKNYSPGTILQELLQLRLVEVKGGRVCLLADNMSYHFDEDRGLSLFARNADALSLSYEENIASPIEEKNVNIRTEYDNIYLSKIPQIRQWLLDEASQFHKRIRDYLTQFDADVSPLTGFGESGGKVIIGSFSITSPKRK